MAHCSRSSRELVHSVTLRNPMQQFPSLMLWPILLTGLIVVSCADQPQTSQDPCTQIESGEIIQSTADLDIDDCLGRVVVLNFWATWCGPCRMEIPALVKLRESFSKEDVTIIGISTAESLEGEPLQTSLRNFIKQLEINYPIFSDVGGLSYRRYSDEFNFGRAIPATLVMDRQGVVQAVHRGVPRDPYGVLGDEIQKILDE